MFYADDAGVVSQSLEQLRKMMGAIVVVCAAFGLTVSEAKTEITCLRAKGMPESTATFSVEVPGPFIGEIDLCRESQGWTTACSGTPECDGKDQGGDSPKQAGSCWFARPCWLATSGAHLYPPGVWFADAMKYFSGIALVLFCFVFVFMRSLKPRPFVQSCSDMQAPR